MTPGMMRRAVAKGSALGTKLPTFAVAGVPAAAANKDRIIRVSNGAAGQPCLAISDGTNWKQVAIGANIAAA